MTRVLKLRRWSVPVVGGAAFCLALALSAQQPTTPAVPDQQQPAPQQTPPQQPATPATPDQQQPTPQQTPAQQPATPATPDQQQPAPQQPPAQQPATPDTSSQQQPAVQPAEPQPEPSATTSDSKAAATPISEGELRQKFEGKTFYLRGSWLGDSLHFNLYGQLAGTSAKASHTLCLVQINHVRLDKRHIEFEGVRYGMHFLGSAPYEDQDIDRVRLSEKKKPLHIVIDREEVEVPKKQKPQKPGKIKLPPAKAKSPSPTAHPPALAQAAPAATSAAQTPTQDQTASAAAPSAQTPPQDQAASASSPTPQTPAQDQTTAPSATPSAQTPAQDQPAPAAAPAPQTPAQDQAATASAPAPQTPAQDQATTSSAPTTQTPTQSQTSPAAAAPAPAPPKDKISHGAIVATSQSVANQTLRTAVDAVFASGIDERMTATLPAYWQLYYKNVELKQDYRPSDPSIYRQSQVDTRAHIVSVFDPPSNEYAQKNGVAGMSMYHVVVGPDGKPGEIVIGRPIGLGLDENAIKAIGQATFSPAMKDGKPVPVVLDLVVEFRIYSKLTNTSAAKSAAPAPDQPVLPGPYSVGEPKSPAAQQPQ